MNSGFRAAIISLGLLLGASPVVAQNAGPGYINDITDCENSKCHVNVLFALRRMKRAGTPPDVMNSELATIAGALFESAREADERMTARRASIAMLQLARYSTDRRQRRIFRLVARAILSGKDDLIDLDDPFAASPS